MGLTGAEPTLMRKRQDMTPLPISVDPRPALIPTVELSAFTSGTEETRLEISSAVDAACRTTGFFLITGHGVQGDMMKEVYRRSREFFDMPAEVKHSCHAEGHGLLGYRGMNSLRASTSSASDSPYDAKELYSIGQEYPPAHLGASHAEFFPPNIWPRDMAGFRAALLAYYDTMCQLTEPLGELFATALGLPGDYFGRRSDGQLSWLVSINYPSQATIPVEPDQWRFGAHRDRSCFTILSTSGPGLEVEDAYGVWHPVPVRPDAFIVNVGSMLAGWTGGRWNQAPYSMVWRVIEADVVPLCEKEGLGQIVWAPIAQGVLTGKYPPGRRPLARAIDPGVSQFAPEELTDDTLTRVQRLKPIAANLGLSMAQLAIAWVLRHQNVASAVVCASTPGQPREAAGASGLTLDAEVLQKIDEVLESVTRRSVPPA